MSVLVEDKPVSTWESWELVEALDRMVCRKGIDGDIAVLAEACSRLLAGNSEPELPAEEE